MAYKGKSVKKNYNKMAKKAILKKSSAVSNGVKMNKPVINPVLKSYVKRIVSGSEEKKKAVLQMAYKAFINGTGFDNAAVPAYGYTTSIPVIPLISQGTTVADRVGNVIRPTFCQVRGYVRASPITATGGANSWPNEPFYVRLVLYRPKSNMSANINSDILDNGSSSQGFDGELDAMLLPYNREKFLIGYSTTFKLQAPAGTVGTNVNNDIGGLPVSKLFKIRVPLPKKLTFVDAQQSPSNARWYLAAGIVNTSGNLAAATDIRATITLSSIMEFTDA